MTSETLPHGALKRLIISLSRRLDKYDEMKNKFLGFFSLSSHPRKDNPDGVPERRSRGRSSAITSAVLGPIQSPLRPRTAPHPQGLLCPGELHHSGSNQSGSSKGPCDR